MALGYPDPEWDVRDLVNHLVVENRWTSPPMVGMTIEEVGGRFEGDLLGDDPKRAWEEAGREAVNAMGAEGAMTQAVHIPAGTFPGGSTRFSCSPSISSTAGTLRERSEL